MYKKGFASSGGVSPGSNSGGTPGGGGGQNPGTRGTLGVNSLSTQVNNINVDPRFQDAERAARTIWENQNP